MALTEQQREKLRILGEICQEKTVIVALLTKLNSGKDINHLEMLVDLSPTEISDIQTEIQNRINTIKTKTQLL